MKIFIRNARQPVGAPKIVELEDGTELGTLQAYTDGTVDATTPGRDSTTHRDPTDAALGLARAAGLSGSFQVQRDGGRWR